MRFGSHNFGRKLAYTWCLRCFWFITFFLFAIETISLTGECNKRLCIVMNLLISLIVMISLRYFSNTFWFLITDRRIEFNLLCRNENNIDFKSRNRKASIDRRSNSLCVARTFISHSIMLTALPGFVSSTHSS